MASLAVILVSMLVARAVLAATATSISASQLMLVEFVFPVVVTVAEFAMLVVLVVVVLLTDVMRVLRKGTAGRVGSVRRQVDRER